MKPANLFVKRPIVVEAYQTTKEQRIETPEGTLIASPGDWIIKGVNGETYPCKPDVFQKTYIPLNRLGPFRRYLLHFLLRQT